MEVYKRPYDPKYPVVCLDETNRQLIEEMRVPATSGNLELVDYEYRRNGVADLFIAFEPLAAKRYVTVTESRKRTDFAQFIRELADEHYKDAEKIVLVMDNLNIHDTASLYQAFPPQEALRLSQRLEIHHTPKHASWLNMAEIEIGVLSRQCLSIPFPHIDLMRQDVLAWQLSRNNLKFTVHWHFNTDDARLKLKRLYPVIADS